MDIAPTAPVNGGRGRSLPHPFPFAQNADWGGVFRRRDDRPEAGTAVLPIFAKIAIFTAMSTMNISLPETLRRFVDEQVADRGYGTSSEYMRELIRNDQDRQHLRGLLLAGASSPPAAPADHAWFASLRQRARKAG